MSQRALFEGLVFSPEGEPVPVALVGDRAHYVVSDSGFKFHIDAEAVDREVLRQLAGQIEQNKDAVTAGTLKMLGQEDLFTKAMVDASLRNLDANFEQLLAAGLPEEARAYLGLMGFRVTLNYHGEVVRLDQPGLTAPDGGGDE